MSRIHWTVVIAIMTLALTLACGGGGGNVPTDEIIRTGELADFTPANPNPGVNSVSVQGSVTTNIAILSVMVTGTAGVYGVSFDLIFDPDIAEFAGYAPGNLLEAGGQQVVYQVNARQAGRVIVGVARTTGTGIDAGVSTALIQLRLRVKEPGVSQVSFEKAELLNSNNPPTEIVGIEFTGGTLTVSGTIWANDRTSPSESKRCCAPGLTLLRNDSPKKMVWVHCLRSSRPYTLGTRVESWITIPFFFDAT